MAEARKRGDPAKFERIPPDGSPVWESRSASLLAFLRQGPKSWDDIWSFERRERLGQSVLTNALAWLENRRLVRSFYADGEIRWTGASASFFTGRDEAADVPVDEVTENRRKRRKRNGRHDRPPHEKEHGEAQGGQKGQSCEDTGVGQEERFHGRTPSNFPKGPLPDDANR